MRRATKILIILACALICAGGALLSVKENPKHHRPKSNAVPIDNREPHQGSWLWA